MNRKASSGIKLLIGIGVIFLLILYQAGIFDFNRVTPGHLGVRKIDLSGNYHTVRAESITINKIYEESGIVSTYEKAMLAPQIMGVIKEIRVKAGDKVKKGDILVVIDSEQFEKKLEQAEKGYEQAKQQLEAAKAGFIQAEKNYKRVKNYYAKRAASQVQLEAAEAGYRQAKAAMKAAEAGIKKAEKFIEEAKIAISYTKLKSPFDGIVTKRMADPGDMAAPGHPILIINNPNRYQLIANIRETLKEAVEVGKKIKIIIGGTTYSGIISEIVPNVDPITRTFPIKVDFKPSKNVFVGMYGKVLINFGKERIIVVPKEAVKHIGQLTLVLVKNKDSVKRRYVKLGEYSDKNRVEVLSGLEVNETLIIEEK